MRLRSTVIFCYFIFLLLSTNFAYHLPLINVLKDFTNELTIKKIADEAFMEAALNLKTELISFYGYPAENHTVITPDGFILTIHRIPSRKNDVKRTDRIPILLMHSLSCQSTQWFNSGEESFAFVLADSGYDVWIGNMRGSRYSSHVNYSSNSKEYWNFSFEQHAELDVASTVDYILNETNRSKLIYIAHSMGTSLGFVLLASKPEYNDKIAGVVALAPVLVPHYFTLLVRGFLKYLRNIMLINNFHVYSLLGISEPLKFVTLVACGLIDPLFCEIGMTLTGGFNTYSHNKTRVPIYSIQCSSKTSIKNVAHYAQVVLQNKVSRFDYGEINNIEQYGTSIPPEYDFRTIKTPVLLFYAANDALITPIDATIVRRELPNVIGMELVPFPMATHSDFTWAADGKILIYNKVLEYLKKFLV